MASLRCGPVQCFFFFFVLGSHLPMSRKLLRDFAALLGGLHSPIKWYNKKKEKERKKQKKRNKNYRQESGCCVLTTLGYLATVVVPGDEPRPAQLQPSLTHFKVILVVMRLET